MPAWSFDPETFAALWYSDANDRFPPPLKYLSRFPTRDEFRAFRNQVHDRFHPDELEEIQLALHILSTSALRIEILGCTNKHRASTGPEDIKEYRILATGDQQRCVIALQGGRADEYGDIQLRLLAAEALGPRLAATIPECRPGQEPTATFHPEDLESGPDVHPAARGPRDRYRNLLGRRGDGYGIARLYVAPLHARPAPARTVRWFDVTRDGRYTESRGTHVTVRPTTTPDLADRFTTWINHAHKELHDQL